MAPTGISLPPSTPFPVTVAEVLCHVGDTISKHQPILRYNYWDYQDDPNSKQDPPPKIRVERIATFESPIEGDVADVYVRPNEEILHASQHLCSVDEPCTHAVQYGGLCALCGKAVEDEKDYTGYNYEDRATIAMSHDNTGLKISLDEATKIEQDTTSRLTQESKLILVVDLDQTVIHATVDPTVGEWQLDPSNPNYRAVKDVQSFCLEEDPILPAGWSGPRPPPTKCWYYVKLRPGLSQFLESVAQNYELHIYTMATRNYALAIAKIIDPDARYFGDRILSRDESGSLTHKNLKRLFPVDQSMVVIIDDRGDVWQWEKNLIKVVPYDFFVGIGDINSSFLPKKNGQLTGPTKRRKTIAQLEALTDDGKEPEEPNEISSQESQDSQSDASSPVERLLELGGGEDNKNLLLEQSLTRNQSLEQQQHDRPLAKLQHNLDKMIHDHESDSRHSSPSSSDSEKVDDEEEEDNLLYDDDTELDELEKALTRIHTEYYKYFIQYKSRQIPTRPDLSSIIPQLKSECLKGVTVLFSGILQLGTNIDNADIVIWCRQFGVRVVNEVYKDEVTHVVCRDPNSNSFKAGLTLKVRVANKVIPNVKIVNPDWLFACLSSWKKVDETPYLIQCALQDWRIEDSDIDKYMKAVETHRAKQESMALERPRFDSVGSLEGYDLDEANQEVDDFLAGITDEDEDEDEEDEEEEKDEAEESNGNHYDSFIRDAYRKRKRDDDDEEEEEEVSKKPKGGEVDLDELEQELLDGFDDLEE